jgi:predicted  nucleic acid-binding Zn-ribbon protein
MTPIIEKLLILQDQDILIIRLERELTDIPQRKTAIDALLDKHRQAVATAKETLKASQAELKKAELEIESFREKIRKFRDQQMQLKSNQEFKAMENEIAAVERNIRQTEDQMLAQMEGIETAQAAVKQREEELRGEEASITRELGGMDARAAAVKGELEQARGLRATLAAEAEPERLGQYDRLFTKLREKVLVPVEDNATCGGCHMKLPPYVFHNARKQTEIVCCGFCGRMLY